MQFEPEIDPIVWTYRDSEGRIVIQEPQATLDPASLTIPITATREEMLYYADILGFGKEGRPTIDDYFSPYLSLDPVTGEYSTEPSLGLKAAGLQLYGSEEELRQFVQRDPNNPINFWEEDPMSVLSGEAQADLGSTLATGLGRTALEVFIRQIDANPQLNWNFEPAWLAMQMAEKPEKLRQAQLELLKQAASNPEDWAQLQQLEPFGPGE